MARNGSGTYSNPYPNFVSGTVISSSEVDANNSDVATALTQSIAVDGQSTVTANLPMNAKKFTGLAAGAAATDSLNLGQAQAEAMIWCGTAGGSANAITLSPTPAITAYAAGQRFVWMASSNVNTGATTVAISGLSTIALQDNGAALVAGNHAASKMFMGILNTTSTMQIMQVQSSGTDPLIISSLTVSGDALIGDDLTLNSDAAILGFGENTDVTLTHVHNTGLLLNGAMQLQFSDSSQFINAPSATVLDITATDEVELNATLVDVNANLDVSGTALITGVTTHGDDVVSDTDSTDDLGTTSVRWANLFVDGITATDQITATGFTGTLDGILGSGTAAAASVTTLTTSGIVSVDDTTTSTSGTTGSIHTDGGLGVAGTAFVAGAATVGGASQFNSTVTVGVDDQGYDVKFFGDAASAYMLWDTSTDDLILGGGARMGIGTSDLLLFNQTGGTTALAVVGDSSSTNVLGNTAANVAIVNKDGTASNTAGLHFARADTDESPNYAGASIVAQFGETQATGQYPSASLSFLTATSQNAAPSLKMTLSATGNLDVLGSITANNFAGRNILYNGAMNVAQRSASETGLGAVTAYFTTDRWKIIPGATAGRFTMAQVADGPAGFANCTKLSCTTADTSIAAGELIILAQNLEGQDLQQIKKGTASAEQLTVSFWVKGNASATYVVELYDNNNARQISKTFAVTTSWAKITLTYPADTTGAFTDNNAHSLGLNIWLHAGATWAGGTLNSSAWAANNNANRAVGISNFVDATSRTFFITGVQMELGAAATEFEHRTYGDELASCQRYYQKTYIDGIYPGATSPYSQLMAVSVGTAVATTSLTWDFTVPMRASPTVVAYSTIGGATGNFRRNAGAADVAVVVYNTGTRSVNFYNNAGTTAGDLLFGHATSSAEL